MTTFSIPLGQLADKLKLELETVVRKATSDVYRAVVVRSPVDTGRFKGNWNVSHNAPNYGTTEAANASRGEAEAAKALALPVGGINYLSNGLPYAQRLEHGWSGQAPAGMVKLSAVEFEDYVKAAIK